MATSWTRRSCWFYGLLMFNVISGFGNVRVALRHNSPHQRKSGPPVDTYERGISYLWPECVIRAMMSRRLSATTLPKRASRSAWLILPSVALTAVAHLSMPSALG